MKKNLMMRLASFLLVAVLISTTAISGTYAKYVTADSASDSARVAKFGVDVTVAGTMFAETYDNEANGNDAIIASGAAITVNSDGTGTITDLVAPGTQGKMTDIVITGTPEVDVRVSYTANVTLSGWAVTGDDFYCPLVIYINDTPYVLEEKATAAEAEAWIEGIIAGYSKTYNENTDLSGKAAENLSISWVWPFETGANAAEIEANDKKDTMLGDAAHDNVADASTFAIDVTCTVTQID